MERTQQLTEMNLLNSGYENIIKWVVTECAQNLYDDMDKENFRETAKRAASAFAEMCRPKSEIAQNCKKYIKTFKVAPAKDQSLRAITQGPIMSVGLCPHHLLPVQYEVYVSYVPLNGQNSKVLGLSKLARLVQEISKYPMLQEDYARNIADILFNGNDWLQGIKSKGSAVIVIGQHGCMACRGIKSNALTSSCEVRGVYCQKETCGLETNFYNQVALLRNSSFFKNENHAVPLRFAPQ